MKVWWNGEIVEDVSVPITAHALHYGTSVFEGIRAYEQPDGVPGIFRLDEHIERLFRSARALHMDVPFTEEEIKQACVDVVVHEGLRDAYIRPIIFYNFGKLGLHVKGGHVDVAVFAFPWGSYLGKEAVRATVVSYRRISEKITRPDCKIGGNYVNSVLATEEAAEKGYDEAILLDLDGYVSEGPGENIFFVRGNTLITPPRGSILPGITRDTVMKICGDLGLTCVERHVRPDELDTFDEAFFVGTAAEVTPIKEIDGIKYATKVGRKVRDYYLDIVHGRVEKYLRWIRRCEGGTGHTHTGGSPR